MIFKPMDQEVLKEILKDQENILAPEYEKHKAFFDSFQCPYCGGGVREILLPNMLFTPEGILPKYLAECNDCGAQFEPYTVIELRGPTKNPLEEST